jgi:hypothetical protein
MKKLVLCFCLVIIPILCFADDYRYAEFSFEEAADIGISVDWQLAHYSFIKHWTKEQIQKIIDENGKGSNWKLMNVQANFMSKMLKAKPDKRIFLMYISGSESLFVKINDNEYLEIYTGI